MYGPILWPSMNTNSTKHDNLGNFKTRGSTRFDFGASGNWKWPMETLSYHELRVKCDVFDQYTEWCVLKQFLPVFHRSPTPFFSACSLFIVSKSFLSIKTFPKMPL